MPRFEEDSPQLLPDALLLARFLIERFDESERREQAEAVSEGQPLTRGTVLCFLPGKERTRRGFVRDGWEKEVKAGAGFGFGRGGAWIGEGR